MAKRKGAQITKLQGGTLRTPKGIARFAYVNRPDDSTYGKDRYRITVVFDKADPEFKAFVLKLKALAELHGSEIGKSGKGNIPIKLVDEKLKGYTGDEVGTPYMEFESNSKFVRNGNEVEVTIPIFNSKGQEEDLQIYGGDIVRVETRVSGWLLNGDHGIKGYLNAVQQLKSNWSGATGTTFGDESDEYPAEEVETEELEEESGSSFADESDDTEPEGEPEAEATEESGDPLADIL